MLKTVRIFRYRRDSGSYSFADYKCMASVEERQSLRDGGAFRRPEGRIRILTRQDIDVRPGDYAALGSTASFPDKERDFMITAVKDDRRGRLPHWRLSIDGRA